MQARHDGAEGAVESARDLAIAEFVDVGQFENASFRRSEAFQRGAQDALVANGMRLGHALVGLRSDHARAHALVAGAAPLGGDGEVV
jgi:hypothetical protein